MSWPNPTGSRCTDDELRGILGRRDPGGLGRHPVVTWRSPRPMSAAALVRHGDATVFVKRHHLSVRTPAQLAAEHAFATHLRTRGHAGPGRAAAGRRYGVTGPSMRRGDFCYEAHQVADGVDLYRDAVSWSPYASLGHAHAAGAALARLHLAAADFGLPARPAAVLMNSCQVITRGRPARLRRTGWLAARPALAAYLAGRGWPADFEDILAPADPARPHRCWPRCARSGRMATGTRPTSPGPRPRPDARVAGIFDFGLANRTFAVHDLALALERAVVSWLDLPETGHGRRRPRRRGLPSWTATRRSGR